MVAEPEHPTEESALIIQVPEAENLVGSYRWEHDPRLGVPAHITLIYPFIPPSLIKTNDHRQLSDLVSGYPSFRISLTEIRRFPNGLYPAPSPKEKFVELIKLIAAAFPDYPP